MINNELSEINDDEDEIKMQYALMKLTNSKLYLVEAIEIFVCDGSIEVNEIKFNDDKAKCLIVNGQAFCRNPNLDIEELKNKLNNKLGYAHFYIHKDEITFENTLRYVELVDIVFNRHYLKPNRVEFVALIKVDTELDFPKQNDYPGWGINMSLKFSNLDLKNNILNLDYLLNVVNIINDSSGINHENWKKYIECTDVKEKEISINIWDDFYDDGYLPEGAKLETYIYVENKFPLEKQHKYLEVLFNYININLNIESVKLWMELYDSKKEFPQLIENQDAELLFFKRWEIKLEGLTHARLDEWLNILQSIEIKVDNLPFNIYSES